MKTRERERDKSAEIWLELELNGGMEKTWKVENWRPWMDCGKATVATRCEYIAVVFTWLRQIFSRSAFFLMTSYISPLSYQVVLSLFLSSSSIRDKFWNFYSVHLNKSHFVTYSSNFVVFQPIWASQIPNIGLFSVFSLLRRFSSVAYIQRSSYLKSEPNEFKKVSS